MVMKPEPWFRAVEAIAAERGRPSAVVLVTPQGAAHARDGVAVEPASSG
jgi:tRNA G37 N-methylase TrmD